MKWIWKRATAGTRVGSYSIRMERPVMPASMYPQEIPLICRRSISTQVE